MLHVLGTFNIELTFFYIQAVQCICLLFPYPVTTQAPALHSLAQICPCGSAIIFMAPIFTRRMVLLYI